MGICNKPIRLVACLLAVAAVVRLPTLFVGFYNPDETYYATIGQRLLEGGSLYSSIVDHKPPIIYYLYALFALVGGAKAIHVAHAAMIAVIAATAYVVSRIADSLRVIASPTGEAIPLSPAGDCLVAAAPRNDRHVGLLAALLYIIGSSLGKPNDVAAANAELLFNLPLALHILFAIRSLDSEGRREYAYACASGLAAAVAVLIKLHAAFVPAATSAYLLVHAWRRKPSALPAMLAYLASLALPMLALASLFHNAGRGHDAFYWVLAANSLYVMGHEDGIGLVVRFAKQTAYMLLLEEAALWLPIASWLAIRRKGERLLDRHGALLSLWLAASAVAIFPGGRFFGHYYLQMLPAACILGTSSAIWLMAKFAHHRPALKAAWALLILIPLAHSWVWSLPIQGLRGKLEVEEFSGVVGYLKEHTSPDEKIEVWGRFNGIPYLAGRENGTRFLSKHFLAGSFRGKDLVKMPDFHWEMYLSDLEKNRPEWFVDISSTNMPNAPITLFPRLSSYLAEHYAFTAEFEGYRIYRRRD